MNKIYRLVFLLLAALTISCSKNDDDTEPLRNPADQYLKDIEDIDEYIDTHYMTVDGELGVTMTKIPPGGTQTSIRNQTEYPLQFKMVEKGSVDYKVYYIDLFNGTNEQPSRVDSVFVSYKGNLLDDVVFDTAVTPIWFTLDGVIDGWQEIVPLFKTGTYTGGNGGDPVIFTDYGAGVMFIPSGLGYFGAVQGGVPKYSPLVFNFKLYSQKYRDHDRDGILSKDEVAVAGDNMEDYNTDKELPNGDELPNYLDVDDDGDSYLTKYETRRPLTTGQTEDDRTYYPFNGAAVDDPLTLDIDETQGVPSCGGDFTTPTRVRNYLDRNCHQAPDTNN